MPGFFGTDPVELFRQNVWMNPFWEDDVRETADAMGTDRVIFGSDWPHIEGMEHPLDYVAELKVFSDEDRKRILLDNVAELNVRRPA
jgi:predicted TIM-barrel fold metal-dependent hydrolase